MVLKQQGKKKTVLENFQIFGEGLKVKTFPGRSFTIMPNLVEISHSVEMHMRQQIQMLLCRYKRRGNG
jgi:hypothetical protein